MKNAVRKETGLKHVFAAASYSWGGFNRLIGEAAFRQELFAFAAGIVLFVFSGATLIDYLVFFILMMALFAFEAVNTAIEELVDRVSPEISAVGKHAKDLGSFAVFCLILANGAFVAYVVLLPLLA